jgi:hypothetical protein
MVDATYQQQLAASGMPGQHVTNGSSMTFQYERDMSFTGSVVTFAGTVGKRLPDFAQLSASLAYRFATHATPTRDRPTSRRWDATFHGSEGT